MVHPEARMTELRFNGSLSAGAGLTLALVLAAAAFWFYWRESRSLTGSRRWLLPGLRALAVFLLIATLTGPVLHHTRVLGQIATVLFFTDTTESMAQPDFGMEAHRKLLIARQLGQLPAGTYDPELRLALDALAALPPAESPAPPRTRDAATLNAAITNLLRAAELAAQHLGRVRAETWPNIAAQTTRFRQEVLTPAAQLADDLAGRPRNLAARLATVRETAARWERQLANAYDDYIRRLAAGGDDTVRRALQWFDTQSRWQRVESLLLGTNLLAELAGKHRLEVRSLGTGTPEILWRGGLAEGGSRIAPPASLAAAPTNRTTDLGAALLKGVEQAGDVERLAVVLFTDGQHNTGPPPAEAARLLGARSIPLLVVGVGPERAPDDVALIGVQAPPAVFVEDRLKGEILLRDQLAAGQSFLLKIEAGGRSVWAETLPSEQSARRTVSFELPVKDLVPRDPADTGFTRNAVPVELQVSVAALGGERYTNNNNAVFRFHATRQRPKVLLVDGRPRWEFRYLRNLLERDAQWEVNAVLAPAPGVATPLPRGDAPGRFPATREGLFSHHLVVLGELPATTLRVEEWQWLRDFVEVRGGGLIFIDGRNDPLPTLAGTPVGALLPVSWQGAPLVGADLELTLTPAGTAAGALALAATPPENETVWSRLPAPRWIAPAEPLAGTETLLHATQGARTASPIVFRRQGAGRVLYLGFDESWRWRYEVADRYHVKFWNQVARWIMDAPYPAADKFVSLDSGPLTYATGDSAELRVQVRDADGRLLPQAKVEAQLFSEGRRVATVPLTGDEGGSGVYRARTEPLADGRYEVRVRVDGLPEDEMKARTTFVVEPRDNGERVELAANEPLLRELAANSGGEYLREEDAGTLRERLAPLSRGKVIESETPLWPTWGWLSAVILLLAVEWFLRKRAGML
jgi:hypothetical protein